MIAPDMATMLVYVFTDAALPAAVLQPLLAASVDRSFNCMTVDGDTSTSDTVLLCATQQAAHPPVTSPTDRRLRSFRRALDAVTVDLAQQVARDGEGAQKFVTIEVTGAASISGGAPHRPDDRQLPIGQDGTFGRRPQLGPHRHGGGKSRARRSTPIDLAISIGGLPILANGGPVPGYDETPVAEHMKGHEITIAVDVGVARGKATVWTCDLTHGYIDINASYRS